jgi:drug/metabolite transporter (DMT)-like permease
VALATSLVLLSALLHAAWNAILKREADTAAGATAINAIAAGCAALWALIAPGPAFPTRESIAWVALSGVCEVAYFVTLARSLLLAPLAVAYTISRGGSVLLVWPISVVWLGERAGPIASIGAATVFFGILATGARPREAQARGVAWAAACAACIACSFLAYKRALAAGASPSALFAASLLVGLPIMLASLGKSALPRVARLVRARPWRIGGAGMVCTISFLLFLAALEASGPGRVLTLRNTSVVFAHAFAWMGGERPTHVQLVGGALVVAGATLLGLG